ncbi:hypothetical protein [Tardiphaga robiniae]|uniref:Uncharacterized protein n=1 Tax=Tardiphaga robiniae TaxID=943830 RepID=A0A7G6U4R3_9BRAD|nr:hypothetical protein [Tardiphaga robiniae]QND73995.1 hypothetical protein HB776_24470 [Tardiphaga robiniae]
MSDVPASKSYEFPKAYGHELLDVLGGHASVAAVVLISYWLFQMAVERFPLPSGWAKQLPSIMAIGILFVTLWLSDRVAFRDAIGRWRYVAAFGIVFWLGTLYQAGRPF